VRSYTEKELLNNQAKYLFHIKNLVKNKQVPIADIGECLNYNLHLNYRDSLKMDYLNEFGVNDLGHPLAAIRKRGLELMGKLIEPQSMEETKNYLLDIMLCMMIKVNLPFIKILGVELNVLINGG